MTGKREHTPPLPSVDWLCRREDLRACGRAAGTLRVLVTAAAALLIALAAVTILREKWAVTPRYTILTVLGIAVIVAFVHGLVKQSRWWLLALFAGALCLRVLFFLYWPIYPRGTALEEWNLALEMSRTGIGGWRELVAATGFAGARAGALPHILLQGMWMKIAGGSLHACQAVSAVFGACSCLLTALIGEKLFASRRIGVLAGALLAFCPTALFASALLTWQHLYTPLLLVGLWLLIGQPFEKKLWNFLLTGAAFGLAQLIRPELPIPLIAAALWGLWLFIRSKGRAAKQWLPACGALLGAFFAVWLCLGGMMCAASGANVLNGALPYRIAMGLDQSTGGHLTDWDEETAQAGMAAAKENWPGFRAAAGQMVRKVRFQLGSYDYPTFRADPGGTLRNAVIARALHPALQSYVLVLLILGLWGTIAAWKRQTPARALLHVLLLGYACAAMLFEADPTYNFCLLPLLAMLAAAPADRTAECCLLMWNAEKKGAQPLSPALKRVRFVLTIGIYAVLLALVLIFFTGNGTFIYEAL
jgi:hypothetical protein